MDEVAARGHNATFATRGDFLRFGKPFERINSVQITNNHISEHEVVMDSSSKQLSELLIAITEATIKVYPEEYAGFKALFSSLSADVVICDYRSESCVDAAKSLGIPTIMTSSIASSPDARGVSYIAKSFITLREPTSLTMSFALRFHDLFIAPVRTIITFHASMRKFEQVRKQVGAPPGSLDPGKDSLKIYNTAFGFEPARPMGPLVEMVGPIVHQNYVPLSPQLKEYLDSHRRVVLIAFGQNFTPTKHGIEIILSALLDNIDKGTIDGFLWATVHANMNNVSRSITLPSGERRDISDIIFGENANCRLAEWVPQQAVLQHPSVSTFLTHGGKGSIYESLFHGVKLVVYPISADQPFNARTVVHLGLGGSFDRHSSSKQASKTLEMVVHDADGEIQRNVDRFQQLVRIRSARGASKGASLVEEVAYMHQGGLLPHRYEASRQMSFFKSTNLDLYAALVVLIVVAGYGSWRVVVYSFKGKEGSFGPKSKVL